MVGFFIFVIILLYMQKFILFVLAVGLALFLYLLKTGYISNEDFNIKNFQSQTKFEIRDNKSSIDSNTKRSDIYAIIKNKEFKIFTFDGDDFNILYKYQYVDNKYKVPVDALTATTGVYIGNRYVFYIIEKKDDNGKVVQYDIYKTEYPTDEPSKLQYTKIKSVDEYEFSDKIEVKY